MLLIDKLFRHGPLRPRYEIGLLLMLVLAFTLPFINQAIHIDAQLDIEWARQELEHPLWQHIPDYDYFGYHYDEFHDTHPRLQSLYLSLFLRLNGDEASEPLLHLAMIPFPLLAAVSMYWLARRFRVNAFVATLLLLISPAFLINSHLIMKDVPGISLWLAGLALFIAGADRDRLLHLLLGAVFLTMSIFVFYQGIAALPLAFLYLVLHRKLQRRPILALSLPVIAFAAFSSAHLGYYGILPNHKYPEPIGLPLEFMTVLMRTRGVITMIGGTALLPVLGLWLFPKSRLSRAVTTGAFLITLAWVAVLFIRGDLPPEHLLLMPLLLASGVAIIWNFAARLIRNLAPALRGIHGQDDIFLAAWFFGMLFALTMLMPYPSPRFLIPLAPPVVIIAVRLIDRRWGSNRERFIEAVTLIAAATLTLSLVVAAAEHERAGYNKVAANWVRDNMTDTTVTTWYSGYLGFQYYLEPYGYPMLIVDRNEPAQGDYIVETLYNGRWPFLPELAKRLELVQTVNLPRTLPVTSFNSDAKVSWIAMLDVMLPYGVTGDFVDRIYVYRAVCDAGQMLDEDKENCIPYEEEPEDEGEDSDGIWFTREKDD